MTLADRCAAYVEAFGEKYPASLPWMVQEQGRDVFYARWVIGANYGNETEFYGSYPRGYLARVMAFFPDVQPEALLHAFSGSLPKGDYVRIDLHSGPYRPELVGNVYDIARLTAGTFSLICADPPYSDADAKKYGTPPVNRLRATRSLSAVARPGAFLVWLDTTWPMHRSDEWVTVGRVALTRSTNHRARDVTFFQRVGS